jgi:hypothetical protein
VFPRGYRRKWLIGLMGSRARASVAVASTGGSEKPNGREKYGGNVRQGGGGDKYGGCGSASSTHERGSSKPRWGGFGKLRPQAQQAA